MLGPKNIMNLNSKYSKEMIQSNSDIQKAECTSKKKKLILR